MELQGTLSHTIMDSGLVQETKTMMHGVAIIVRSITKVPGGIITVTGQTLMGSTIVHALTGVMG